MFYMVNFGLWICSVATNQRNEKRRIYSQVLDHIRIETGSAVYNRAVHRTEIRNLFSPSPSHVILLISWNNSTTSKKIVYNFASAEIIRVRDQFCKRHSSLLHTPLCSKRSILGSDGKTIFSCHGSGGGRNWRYSGYNAPEMKEESSAGLIDPLSRRKDEVSSCRRMKTSKAKAKDQLHRSTISTVNSNLMRLLSSHWRGMLLKA